MCVVRTADREKRLKRIAVKITLNVVRRMLYNCQKNTRHTALKEAYIAHKIDDEVVSNWRNKTRKRLGKLAKRWANPPEKLTAEKKYGLFWIE
jgi:hypothetical protein